MMPMYCDANTLSTNIGNATLPNYDEKTYCVTFEFHNCKCHKIWSHNVGIIGVKRIASRNCIDIQEISN